MALCQILLIDEFGTLLEVMGLCQTVLVEIFEGMFTSVNVLFVYS